MKDQAHKITVLGYINKKNIYNQLNISDINMNIMTYLNKTTYVIGWLSRILDKRFY